jgi:hypothetical protein
MPIKTTGNRRIDTATAEIAGLVRDARVGSHVRYCEQDHYDTAAALRDEILAGARTLVLTELAGELLARSGGNDAAREPILLPASASPQMITDDIALNMAATVLDAMGYGGGLLAAALRDLRPEAEGKVHGQPYQEPAGKWPGSPQG